MPYSGPGIWDYATSNPVGGITDYRQWKGKPVVIIYYTATCGACQSEGPYFRKEYDNFKRKFGDQAGYVHHEGQFGPEKTRRRWREQFSSSPWWPYRHQGVTESQIRSIRRRACQLIYAFGLVTLG